MLPLDLAFLAYVGPETVLPVASVLAGIVGVFLTCGRYLKHVAGSWWRMLFRRQEPQEKV